MQHTRAACPEGLELAKKALSRKGWSQAYLATQVVIDDDNRIDDKLVSTSTVKRFFRGEGIRAALFGGICAALELEPDEIEGIGPSAPGLLPSRGWSVPYDRNPFLTGRETVLQGLRAAFGDVQTTEQPIIQVVSGLGGVGKTQVAVEYAYRYEQDYQSIFWVRAETETERIASFLTIAQALQLPIAATQPPDVVMGEVLNWLTQTGGWLLVFDNADQPEQLKLWRPRRGRGHILLTSRAQRFDSLGVAQPVRLDTLLPSEAVTFLLQRTGRSPDEAAEVAAASQIATEVGYLPLALEQAAAYILDRQIRFQDYLTIYQQHRLAVLQRSRPVVGDYSESVATTWALNFRQVEKVSSAAADLLRISAFLAPEAIPYELFEQGVMVLGTTSLGAVLASAASDLCCMADLLAPLAQYSLVNINPTARTFGMHRLVKEAVRHDLINASATQTWAILSIEMLGSVFPEVEFEQWDQCDRLLPHGLASQGWIEDIGYQSPQSAQLLNRVGHYLLKQGRYDTAEPLLQTALSQRQQLFGADHPAVAESLYQLGALRRAQGRYSDSEILYCQALEQRQQFLDQDDPDLAASFNDLALLYRDQGRFSESEPLHRQALAIRQRIFAHDHPDVATSLNDLGLNYWKQRQYEAAEPLFIEALEIYRRLGSDMHPSFAICANNLALIYQAQGRYGEAEPLYQTTLNIYEQVMGTEHPNVATALHNLAGLCKARQMYDRSQALYEQAIALRRQLLGDGHPHLASSLHQLATVYALQGSFPEAQALYEAALEIRSRVLGPQHSATLKTLNALTELHQSGAAET